MNVCTPAEYLFLAKNVRGCLLIDPDAPPQSHVLQWLVRKHRYRCIGLPPALSTGPIRRKLKARCYRPLQPPNPTIAALLEHVQAAGTVPTAAAQAVILASAYGCVLFLTEATLKQLRPAMACRLPCEQWPDQADLLRHLRIADYAVLDTIDAFAVEAARRLGEGLSRTALIRDRAHAAEQDMFKRFWRLKPETGRELLGGYFDPLKLWQRATRPLQELLRNSADQLAPALGLPVGLRIDVPAVAPS